MKYQELSLEVNAPIDFVFNFLTLHENFEKINATSSLYECEYLDKDLLSNGGSVKAGLVYNMKIQAENLIFLVGCLTLVVEKNKKIKYRYIYNDIAEDVVKGFPLGEAAKSDLLNTLNETPLEASWVLKDLGKSKTQLVLLMEKNGNRSFLQKIYDWLSSLSSSRYKKESARLFTEIKGLIEMDYQSN